MHKAASALLLGASTLTLACGSPRTNPGDGGAAAASATPGSDDEKTIYALGASFGRRVVRPLRLSETELAALQKGIADTARGGEPDFDVAPYQQRFQALAQERAAAGAVEERQRAEAFCAEAAKEKGAVKTPSGLVYRTITPGRGASPGPDSLVRVQYRGTLRDGTEFDSSIARGRPAEFRVGGVIPCWQEGLQRMKVGEKAKLVCPPDIAYGNRGAPPDIPPGAALVFEVELLGIQGGQEGGR
jgi:FKBP-type peptidyl-prolyl cis-trans isomerase FkpA